MNPEQPFGCQILNISCARKLASAGLVEYKSIRYHSKQAPAGKAVEHPLASPNLHPSMLNISKLFALAVLAITAVAIPATVSGIVLYTCTMRAHANSHIYRRLRRHKKWT